MNEPMTSVMRWLLVGYTSAALAALMLVPASDGGWLSPEADAAAAMLALALALPWSPLLLMVPSGSAWLGGATLAMALAANILAGVMLLRWIEND